jgi:hypothetical protein
MDATLEDLLLLQAPDSLLPASPPPEDLLERQGPPQGQHLAPIGDATASDEMFISQQQQQQAAFPPPLLGPQGKDEEVSGVQFNFGSPFFSPMGVGEESLETAQFDGQFGTGGGSDTVPGVGDRVKCLMDGGWHTGTVTQVVDAFSLDFAGRMAAAGCQNASPRLDAPHCCVVSFELGGARLVPTASLKMAHVPASGSDIASSDGSPLSLAGVPSSPAPSRASTASSAPRRRRDRDQTAGAGAKKKIGRTKRAHSEDGEEEDEGDAAQTSADRKTKKPRKPRRRKAAAAPRRKVGSDMVSQRVKVFWETENSWFSGIVTHFDHKLSPELGGEYMVLYDDGDVQMEVRESLVLDGEHGEGDDDGDDDDAPPTGSSVAVSEPGLVAPSVSAAEDVLYGGCLAPVVLRRRRWRAAFPIALARRYARALSERQIVVSFSEREGNSLSLRVQDSSGLHSVAIDHEPRCSCEDFRAGSTCKHIMFTLMFPLGVPRASPLVYQLALVDEELKAILDNARPRPPKGNRNVDGGTVERLPLKPTAVCLLCFSYLDPEDGSLVWCRGSCGENFHGECFALLREHTASHRGILRCPCCGVAGGGWK